MSTAEKERELPYVDISDAIHNRGDPSALRTFSNLLNTREFASVCLLQLSPVIQSQELEICLKNMWR